MRICDIEGCERKYHAKGLCVSHYNSRPENKLMQKEVRDRPENKLRIKEYGKEYNSRPENKLRQKEYGKEYDSRPENKLRKKEYNSRPENKLRKKEYDSRPENKLRKKEYDSRPENKLRKKEYNSKPENKLRVKENASKPENKLRIKEYDSRPENKLRKKEYAKQHPEVDLKSKQKQFKKLSNELGVFPFTKIPIALYSWGKTVRKRFGNYCHVCGSIKQVESHHIFHKMKYPLLSLNENNGIPLCWLHHQQAHGKLLIVCR